MRPCLYFPWDLLPECNGCWPCIVVSTLLLSSCFFDPWNTTTSTMPDVVWFTWYPGPVHSAWRPNGMRCAAVWGIYFSLSSFPFPFSKLFRQWNTRVFEPGAAVHGPYGSIIAHSSNTASQYYIVLARTRSRCCCFCCR